MCDLTKISATTHKLFNELARSLKGTDDEYRYSLGVNGIDEVCLTDFSTGTDVKGNEEIQDFIKNLLKEKAPSKENQPAFMTEWSGTRKEFLDIIENAMDDIQVSMDIRISVKDMRKLFLDAFSRNVVQNEIRSVIADILKDTDILYGV